MQPMILVYTTCKDVEEATRLGQLIIEKKLGSCVNIWRIQSMYMGDNGELTNQLEAAVLIKTLEPKLPDIEEVVSENHSYATPFIGAWDVRRLNRPYREWMRTVM